MNTNRITALDATYSTSTSPFISQTHYLVATNFGFLVTDIPVGATITGIAFRFTRFSSSMLDVGDAALLPVKGGVITGVDQSGVSPEWSYSGPRADVIGGNGNVWGTVWSQADIVGNAGFGVVMSADIGQNATLYVDGVECRVWFTTS